MKIKNENKKCLFVLPWELHHPGGVNQVVINLYEALKKINKIDPLVLINSWPDVVIKKKKINNKKFYYFRMRKAFYKVKTSFNYFKYILFLPYELLCLFYLIRKEKIVAINIHYPGLSSLQFSILKKLKVFKGKLVFSFHGRDLRTIKETTNEERAIWIFILEQADYIICCSDQLREIALNLSPKFSKKLQVIPNGIDKGNFLKKMDKSYKLPKNLYSVPYILNVGTFDNVKGQDILIKAFKDVSIKHEKFKLILIGRRTEHLLKLKQIISKLELNDKILMFENLNNSQLSCFYENATLFVLPSRNEGLPIVLLEAGVFKLPIIASNVGGIPELIENNVDGILTESENITNLKEKIIFLINNTEKRKELGQNLHNKVCAHFTFTKSFNQFVNLIAYNAP